MKKCRADYSTLVRLGFAERNIEAIRGPVNPSLNYECGLLIDGFHEPPWFMMTYNKPYYGRLIEQYGFRKAQDLFAFWGHIDMLDEISKRLYSISHSILERLETQMPTDERFRGSMKRSKLS